MKLKVKKENLALTLILVLSAVLNFTNLSIEGYSNAYYAAGVKSMTMSLKNFFFVALDPAGFVTIDKPPLGFWMQAISAKLFGFNGWSILIPQALAGVLSVLMIYQLVKRSFGIKAALISALCLTITPVFTAVSRNNTVDNQLVFVLLLACWMLSHAAEKGKLKYLILGMAFIGIGFNIKMLQAYMILPAVYILYLFSNSISIKKRIMHLIVGTGVLLLVSLSWALVVDSIPAANRPYIGSSNNNTVMGLITGHNGSERLSFFSKLGGHGGGFSGGAPPTNNNHQLTNKSKSNYYDGIFNSGMLSNPSGNMDSSGYSGGHGGGNMQPPTGGPGGGGGPSGGGPGGGGSGGGGNGGLSGTFGNQTPAGITRLFSKNVLSDQIVWFIPLAVLGFIAAGIREKLGFRLNNKRKQALALWFMWFLPEFIYFSFNTGLFHSYYLTMLAPPIAALAGIGIVAMWEMYKEGGWKSWFLPVALLANGAIHLLMLTYFYSSSNIVKILMGLLIVLCFVSALVLAIINLLKTWKFSKLDLSKIKHNKVRKCEKVLLVLALIGLMITPAVGTSTVMFYAVNSSFPGAGLELLPTQQQTSRQKPKNNAVGNNGSQKGFSQGNTGSTQELISFLNQHQVNGKSQIVVNSSNTAENLILNSDAYVGSLSGFMGNETVMSLDRFKTLVKNGEVRYVLADENSEKSNRNSEIIKWVQENGKLVSYASTTTSTAGDSKTQNSKQVYDLISYTESTAGK